MREGAGGYGGITTLNTDQRQGKYFPHKDIFITRQHPDVYIKCFTCKATWAEGDKIPAICKKKDDWVSAEEILKGQPRVFERTG